MRLDFVSIGRLQKREFSVVSQRVPNVDSSILKC